MALTFTCDLCGHTYPARISINRAIEYKTEDGSANVDAADSPCHSCQERISQAEETVKQQIIQEKETHAA